MKDSARATASHLQSVNGKPTRLGIGYQLRYTVIAILAPVIRIFPPWWKARFYGRIVGDLFGKTGDSGSVKRRRVSPHHYEMELQLDDPMERFAYFVGCYWGIDVTVTVLRLLRSGDCFVDVGANLGFLTLTASKKVGPGGKVFCFEPFADIADRLRRTLINNTIENVTVHQCALGDVESEGMLDHDDHSSKANLRRADKNGEKIKIMLGDHVLNDFAEDTWVFAKLDVEGYELRALKGFQSLVNRPKTGFLVEITDEWLRDLGGSADELFDLMLGSGFKAYIPKVTLFSQFEVAPNQSLANWTAALRRGLRRPEDSWLSG